MKQAQAARKISGADSKTNSRSLYLVHLESEVEASHSTHDLFVDAETAELSRRAAMIAQLKLRVQAGTYRPSLELIAQRMLDEQ